MVYSSVLIKQLSGIQRRDDLCLKMRTFDCLRYSIYNEIEIGDLMSKK